MIDENAYIVAKMAQYGESVSTAIMASDHHLLPSKSTACRIMAEANYRQGLAV